jgi:hypothetical protein
MKVYKHILIALTLLLSACVSSLNPFYYPGDIVSFPKAQGNWVNSESTTEKWTFSANDSIYNLTIKDKKGSGNFQAVFFRIGTQDFIDLSPSAGESVLLKDYLSISTHVVAKVESKTDSLILHVLDGEWLDKAIESQSVDLHKAQSHDGHEIILDDTQMLQVFLRNNMDNAEAFGVKMRLSRN